MNYKSECEIDGATVTITRSHGDDAFRAVVHRDQLEIFLYSSVGFQSGVRTVGISEMPHASYMGRMQYEAAVRLHSLLGTALKVMEKVMALGLEYDKKKAKRVKARK